MDCKDYLIVGNVSDNDSALDVAHFFGQKEDVSDIISLKTFENTEFCPRFISHPEEFKDIGNTLSGKAVIIVSTAHSGTYSLTRNDLAMRNMLVARAAKDNGAKWVLLVEPDLFYSAQDRGPRADHGRTPFPRDIADRHKFNGQPFSSMMYAEMLKVSGVDEVMTVHNHSLSVQDVFRQVFSDNFTNLKPHRLYARYIMESRIVDTDNLVLCAPDKGALPFVELTAEALDIQDLPILVMDKIRTGERKVSTQVSPSSSIPPEYIKGKDVIVIDDMVRTGGTIVNACNLIRTFNPNRINFLVTHFHSCPEGRQNMASPVIDEIITTNTIPSILNRDMQGRLRRKMAVLKLGRWIGHHLRKRFGLVEGDLMGKWYMEDISSKNPRSAFKY